MKTRITTKPKEPRKLNDIFDDNQSRRLKRRKAFKEYIDRAYKRMDNLFDLGMAMLMIVNILFFMWNPNYYTPFNIGFVGGLWLANIMYRGLRRL